MRSPSFVGVVLRPCTELPRRNCHVYSELQGALEPLCCFWLLSYIPPLSVALRGLQVAYIQYLKLWEITLFHPAELLNDKAKYPKLHKFFTQ